MTHPAVDTFLSEREEWQNSFDRLLQFASEGVLKTEILNAKEVFFSKLGRAHEMREDLYETASQAFLEWYLFDYRTKAFGKSPAVVYLTVKRVHDANDEWIEHSLFDHWSLFEVKAIRGDEIELEDLLFGKTRLALIDRERPEAKVWKIETGQIIQARLFHLKNENYYFFTHVWLHPETETKLLKQVAEKRRGRWSSHKDVLMETFEAVVRTLGLQTQLTASQSHNWLYQEIWKKYYAEAR